MKYHLALLFLRLTGGGIMLAAHGFSKLMNYSAMSSSFPDPIGVGSQVSLILAIFAEVLCSLFLIIGLFTRFAAIPLIVTMMVAALIVHGSDPFAQKEMALLYGTIYIALFLAGPGQFSVDRLMGKGRV